MAGRKVVTWVEFENDNNPVLEVQDGLSAVSTDGAMINLEAEALRPYRQQNANGTT